MISPKKDMLITILIFFLLSSALYIYKPVSVEEISSVKGFIRYAKSFGPIMPFAVMAVTIIQAIFPVIPFVILCSANGILFGLTEGVLLTWIGTLAGASLVFFTARRMGYNWAESKYKQAGLKNLGDMEGLKGFWVILALRLLPYFPAPLLNLSAGVSRVGFCWFLLASALGKMPFIIGYTLLGYTLLNSKNYTVGIAVMAAMLIIPYLLVRKTRKKAALESKE